MNSLFQRHSDRRGEFEELRKVLERLRESDNQTRLDVGAGVDLANAEFVRQFGGIESFRRMPAAAHKKFAAVLSDLELESRDRSPGVAMGVGLYRIWLSDMLAGRREIAETLGGELTKLSRNASRP